MRIGIASLLCALALSLSLLSPANGGEPAPKLPEVGVMTITPRDIVATFELNGRATPYLIAEVRPQVNGIIKDRLFEEGGMVKSGMPLYQIDPAIYEAELNSAKAAEAKAKAGSDVAKTKKDRYDQLIKAKAINQQDYDEVAAAWEEAVADVGVAKANTDRARINLEYTHVLSPIDGIIGKSSVTPGALVTASQSQAMATVQQLDPIYVDATQATAVRLRLRRNIEDGFMEEIPENKMEVELVLEDGSIYKHRGKVKFTDITVDQSTGSVGIRTEFPNADSILLPGMYVKARVAMARKSNAILVPQQSLTRDATGRALVTVISPSGEAERREVQAVRAIGNEWLLSSGIEAGEKVVVQGTQLIRFIPGQPAPKVTTKELTYADIGLEPPAPANTPKAVKTDNAPQGAK